MNTYVSFYRHSYSMRDADSALVEGGRFDLTNASMLLAKIIITSPH